MRLKNNFDSSGKFHGFSVWANGEWTTAADYKTVVLSYRRACEEFELSESERHYGTPRAWQDITADEAGVPRYGEI